MTAAGSATTVAVGSDLLLTATTDTFSTTHYQIVWSIDEETRGTLDPDNGSTSTLTGVSAGAVVITAEVKAVTYVGGTLTLVSLSTPVTDTINITVTSE
ncbi:MAG TPA: Ig-like domain-containing protein [Bacillota bacterium]|nr:Ig-like domain-containing protein [Bacillota bacterium]